MDAAAIKNLYDFIYQSSGDTDSSRQHLAAEVRAFTQLIEYRAETLSLVDYCYWRKAIEDVLEHGQRRLYERYEASTRQ
jgi:hypothetical protein